MSIHQSLVPKSALKRHRNVLTKTERIERLQQEGKWGEEQGNVYGLPKVRNIMPKAKVKVKKDKTAAEGETAKAGKKG